MVDEIASSRWPITANEGEKRTSQRIKMTAQYDDGISKENSSFAKATPSGELIFQVDNPAVHGFFEPGKAYYLDITESP